MTLSECGKLAFRGIDANATTSFSIGTRAGRLSGYVVRAGRVYDYCPASYSQPAGTRVVDVTEQAIAAYRDILRHDRLLRAIRLGAPARITDSGNVVVAARNGRARQFASLVLPIARNAGEVAELHQRFPSLCEVAEYVSVIGTAKRVHVFAPFPGRTYVRLRNGQLLPHDGGRWDASLLVTG